MKHAINNYVFKAIDAYPYDVEEAVEALNYALSYDAENTMALTLMGRVYAEKLYNYVEAVAYYKEVLAIKIDAFEVYEHYINALLWNEDLNEAQHFIEFALTVKGADKAVLYLKKAALYEQLKQYKEALVCIKYAKENAFNAEFLGMLHEQKKRVKDKMPVRKRKKKAKKNEKKKK